MIESSQPYDPYKVIPLIKGDPSGLGGMIIVDMGRGSAVPCEIMAKYIVEMIYYGGKRAILDYAQAREKLFREQWRAEGYRWDTRYQMEVDGGVYTKWEGTIPYWRRFTHVYGSDPRRWRNYRPQMW